MTAKSKKILNTALELSEKDRYEVARRLLESLSSDEKEAFADTWEAELKRRLAQDDPGIPWEVVRRLG